MKTDDAQTVTAEPLAVPESFIVMPSRFTPAILIFAWLPMVGQMRPEGGDAMMFIAWAAGSAVLLLACPALIGLGSGMLRLYVFRTALFYAWRLRTDGNRLTYWKYFLYGKHVIGAGDIQGYQAHPLPGGGHKELAPNTWRFSLHLNTGEWIELPAVQHHTEPLRAWLQHYIGEPEPQAT